MAEDELIPAVGNVDADFALRLDHNAPAPLLSEGKTVYIQRRTDLFDGDVGLFYSREGMVFRQFCQDSAGNSYLFSLDRARAEDDLMIRPGGEMPICYGRVVLSRPIPLPMD